MLQQINAYSASPHNSDHVITTINYSTYLTTYFWTDFCRMKSYIWLAEVIVDDLSGHLSSQECKEVTLLQLLQRSGIVTTEEREEV